MKKLSERHILKFLISFWLMKYWMLFLKHREKAWVATFFFFLNKVGLGLQKNWGSYRDSYTPGADLCTASPISNTSLQKGISVTIHRPTLTRHITQSPCFTSEFTLGVVHAIDFDESIITCIYHCSSVQNNFMAKYPLYSACSSFLLSQIPGNH